MSPQPPAGILIVDDERIVATDLQQVLTDMGYDAYAIAGSAEEAMARASERCPDLVLMDIKINGHQDGIEAAAMIRARFPAAIIYLTAYADEATIERVKKTEPDGYLLKPVNTAELRSSVEIALFKHWLDVSRARAAEVKVQEKALLEEMSRELRENHERFRMMVDAVRDYAIVTLDTDGRVASWNTGAERLKGYSDAEIIGQHFSKFHTAVDLADGKPERELATAVALGRCEDEGRRVRKDGSEYLASVVITAVRDPNGMLRGFIKVTRDVTAIKGSEKALLRAEEQFRLAIEVAPTGMLLMSLTGSIVLVNAQIEKLFGHTRRELVGRQFEMLIPERYRSDEIDRYTAVARVTADSSVRAARDLFGLRKDGSELPIEITHNPLHTSEAGLLLSSIVDLSPRREMERLRAEFISTVSHELRTPLTSISGSLGLLQTGAMGALPDKAAAMVRIAYKNSGRLVRIINDILDVGGLESGKLTLQMGTVPLADLLRQAIEGNVVYAEKYDVRFVLDGAAADDAVLADPDRLMQVIANLLSNAVKFSPPGGRVLVRVMSVAAMLRVEIEDSGPGIAEAFKSRIFEKFAQADASATRRFEGTGLGLSISRNLIEAMGGTIGFSSEAGKGSIFHFELPRASAVPVKTPDARDLRAGAAPDVPRSNRAPRALYVEDDEDLISVIRATLAGRADIVGAHTLREAERLLQSEAFDLIIIDLILPDGNGMTLVERIPGLTGRAVPVIILSTAEVPAGFHGRVDAVLVKAQVSTARIASTILSYLPRPPL